MTWTDTTGKKRQGKEPLTRTTIRRMLQGSFATSDQKYWSERLRMFDEEWE